jgi:hypothetical protein
MRYRPAILRVRSEVFGGTRAMMKRISQALGVSSLVLAVVTISGPAVGHAGIPRSTPAHAVRIFGTAGSDDVDQSAAMVDVQASVSATPDGGQVDTYALPDGTQLVTATPPASFDPLTASDQSLSEYGFPVEPTDPVQRADWLTAMSDYQSDPPPSTSLPVPASTGTSTDFAKYQIWAGWSAGSWSGTSNTYVGVKGDITIPNPSNSCNDSNFVGFWVGLGGTNGDLDQQGVECGDTALGSGASFRPWSEYANTEQPLNFCAYTTWKFSAGDVIYNNMSYQASSKTTYWYMEDETTGVAHSCNTTNPKGWSYSGNTAEWEAEAPPGETTNFGHTKFTDAYAELSSNGSWVTLGSQSNNEEIAGTSSSYYCMYPDSINSNTSFSVYFNQTDCYD